MRTYTEAELALIAVGPHTLEAFPDDFVIHRTEKRVFTPANIGGGNVLARCPDGQERWLSPTDFGKLAHFAGNAQARRDVARRTTAPAAARSAPAPAPRRRAAPARKALTKAQLNAIREREQRAEWDRQTAAHQERMRTDRAYRDRCSNPLKALGLE